jgi:DNA ligase-1
MLRGYGQEEKRVNESDFERLAKALEDVPEEAPQVTPAPMPTKPPEAFQDVLLAEKWTPAIDPTGYWMSEKLDGVRAYWDGSAMYSRNGNPFAIPDWFWRILPRGTAVDGELYVGPGKFNESVSIVRSGTADPARWRSSGIKYMAFDLPDHPGLFEDRMRALDRVASTLPFLALRQTLCTSPKHLKQFHDSVTVRGIEGTMLREPNSYYERKRSKTLLKVKDFHDVEARVIGYVPGAGRHKGRLGAYEAELKNGTRFSVGTGLSDKDREKPVRIGTVITVRYQELTPAGVPRFPSFISVRDYE